MAWMARQKAKGLCAACNLIAVDGWYCARHKLQNALGCRNRYRTRVGIPLDAPKGTRAKGIA